uniref:Uncharacterized protein n=1 Tax=Nelumbo nucifera TaxID=4432 RepID=A0A822Z237_NELNU|nr:TPA_asm: hypothetical protein HUJ06_012886 [Nelumbo nucifera]
MIFTLFRSFNFQASQAAAVGSAAPAAASSSFLSSALLLKLIICLFSLPEASLNYN